MALILIIDDNKALCAILNRMLEAGGHTVVQADTGRAAIQILRHQPPDLVLTDIVMPDQDGLDVIMMIRKELPKIPVIAMSGGHANTSLYLDLAKKLGARRMLKKPFTSEQLFAALEDVWGPRNS